MNPEIFFSVVISAVIGPVLTILVTLWMQRRKMNADVEAALGNALEGAGTTLERLFKRLNDLDEWKSKAETRIVFLETELNRYVNWAGKLFLHIKKIDPDGKIGGSPPSIETDPSLRKALGKELQP